MHNLKQSIAALPSSLKPQAAPGTWESALGELPSSGTVLVAGAGRGGISLILDQAGFQVTSLDLHAEHFSVNHLKCDTVDLAKVLPYPDGSFHTVLAVEVIEHLENPWFFLNEAARVLAPNGRIIVTSPNVMSVAARLSFFFTGELPYFRRESFEGCFHVTPIFSWAIERWCSTIGCRLVSQSYSRVDWPSNSDVPRYYSNPIMRTFKSILPLSHLTGEITCYVIEKTGVKAVEVGHHSP